MSQHDFNIANQGFPATRADINNAFQAIASNSSGATAPSTTYANMWWYDTTNNKMYLRNEADSAWIEVATIDQTNNEWQITTGVVKAKDSDGLALQTDDGTTRLFIKDSDGAVGIGTASPSTNLDVADSGNASVQLTAYSGTQNCPVQIEVGRAELSGPDSFMLFKTHDGTSLNEVARIDKNGNLGIGTSSPSYPLHVDRGATGDIAHFEGQGSVHMRIGEDSNNMYINSNNGNAVLAFRTNGVERARINASGNFLVGKTSSGDYVTGFEVQPAGAVVTYRTSGVAAIFGRTDDGEVVRITRNSAAAGQIGAYGARPFFASTQCGIRLTDAQLMPTNSSGANSDNTMDIGASATRYDDIYATNGTIQTSDQNEKQQIASLTDAEITAAKAISKLFKTFKWNDSVAEKGDAARTHTGVIAQEVEQAMTDAGLNAGDYAFFISTTWWETQTEVPAVEAVEAVDATYDEDGNVLTEAVEAVEAQEAYTRTDTYETAEEAPEGATERNRKGIRYPQLLSFIGAATEQRLASIESRLDALEA
jgi:hypothetical protein